MSVTEVIQGLETKLAAALKAKRMAQRKAGCAIEWLKIIEGETHASGGILRETAASGLTEVRKIK